MKKSMKIFSILLVSLITLISVVCVTAFATEAEETLDITLKKNIAVTDKIQAVYAVKADENITVENTTLTVYDKDPSTEGVAVVWSGYGVEENLVQFNNDKYIVFYTNRVALYAMAEFFYVQVESNGVKSGVETYSVAEYLFDRLYKDGFVNKTEDDGENYSRKMFYEDLVRTGKSSFDVLTHTVEKSIADLAYVYVDGATLADGSVTAVVDKNSTITLGTLPSGKSWLITNYPSGEVTETKESALVLDGYKVITLVSNLGNGKYFSDASFGASAKYDYNNITPTKENVIHSSTADYVISRLKIEEGALAANSSTSSTFGLNNGGSKNGTTYVFETDFFMEGTTSTKTGTQTAAWMGISAEGISKDTFFLGYSINYEADENGFVNEITLKEYKDGRALTTISTDQWYNLRFEYTPVEGGTYYGQVKLYVNDVEVISYRTGSVYGAISNESFECFGIQIRKAGDSGISTTYKFDNTFMSAID